MSSDDDNKVIDLVQKLKDVHKGRDSVLYELSAPREEMRNYAEIEPADREIDWKDVELFLAQLDPDQDSHTFQTLFDNEEQKAKYGDNAKKFNRVIHEDYHNESFRERMQHLNQGGLAICCTINQTDFNGRKKQNIVKVRALIADLDGAPLNNYKQFPLRPHAVVESSPGRYHIYWFVKDFPLKFFSAAQEALAGLCHSDPQIVDLNRAMRLPGTFHNKDIEHIYRSRLLFVRNAPRYAGRDVLTILRVSRKKPTKTPTVHKGTRNNTLFRQAVQLVSQGKDTATVLEEILNFNQAQCNPPLSENEVKNIVASACKKALPPATKPRFIWGPDLVSEAVDFMNETVSTRYNIDDVFQRGNQLVFIKPPGKEEAIQIFTADEHSLDDYFARISEWYVEGKDEFKAIAVPKRAIRAFQSAMQRWKATPLEMVTDFPILHEDGSVHQEAGYDATTSALYLPGKMRYIPIDPEKLIPTPEKMVLLNPHLKKAKKRRMVYVKEARDKLLELYQDFPFVKEYHRSVAVAFPLSGLAITTIGRSPAFASSSPESTSGKSLLLDIGHCIVAGHPARGMTVAKESEVEFKKVLISLLREGKIMSIIDNLSFPFASDALCSALIQPSYQDRLLHSNNIPSYSTRTVFGINGKNLVIKGDMRTRSIITRIDPKMANPGLRNNFKIPKLIPHVLAHRPEYMRVGQNWLIGYIKAGRPDQHLPHFARFDNWNELVRPAIVWLGMEDPCLSIKDIWDNEPEDALLVLFLHTVYDLLCANEHKDFTIAELVLWSEGSGQIQEKLKSCLIQIAGKVDRIDPNQLRAWMEPQQDKRRGKRELYLSRLKKTMRGVTYTIFAGK